jgi:(1->4)-alpha-D-glucan 1-alpha-D-glucosylmutase
MTPRQGTQPLGSTYRLQLNGLGFGGARRLVPYLADLGIETLYVSPLLAAAPGSTHGYDVIDPTRLDPHLGTPQDYEALLRELDSHHMRLLIDAVPNHMAAHPDNRWWWDVQRRGTTSEAADVFDVDWSQHQGRVLIPTLPAPLADLQHDVRVVTADGTDEPVIRIGDQSFPLDPDSLKADRDSMALLARQHYRPAFWRVGGEEGNYRRFFDIDGLVGVRVEVPEVRERTHAFVLSLLEDERVAGLRLDHIDGLADPQSYLQWLDESLAELRPSDVTVLIEKILTGSESLPAEWEVDGTTGYEFAAAAGGLFVDPYGAEMIHQASETFSDERGSFAELGRTGKREVLGSSFAAPLRRLSVLIANYLAATAPGTDLAVADLERALTELVVQLPVYRTYLGSGQVTPADRDLVRDGVAAATALLNSQGRRAARMIAEILLGSSSEDAQAREIAQRWEQLSGAVMAKGVEDTASYRYAGLLSHCEVGSDPDHASCSVDDFFAMTNEQGRRHPLGLNATSTHDSKRSEDTRARLYALSEAAPQWSRLVRSWHRRHVERLAGAPGPGPVDELLIYQTLVGLWPIGPDTLSAVDWERVSDYVVKAAREAKRRTSWIDPDDAYEDALRSFIALLGGARTEEFRDELRRFVRVIAPSSATNGLALTVLKSVCPGVPDFYQGTELWTHTLTDPDNRGAIDFDLRRAALGGLPGFLPSMEQWEDGRIKLLVTHSLLQLRRERPALFSEGAYFQVVVDGPLQEHVVALGRRHERDWLIAVVPRLVLQHLAPGQFPVGPALWADTRMHLPDGSPEEYTDVFTGRSLSLRATAGAVGEVLGQLPVAVLHATSAT